ncbi:MAG: PHP domain-containing protein [Clostridia bacterium]|nr:PHP domain-containing protein [Clostridia bacterium]
MKCWVDLHVHSCLSPCADDDMTPNNIVNMAVLKGLDIIAVTDHNAVHNSEALISCGQRAGLVVIPGMELCTSEEIHLICLFRDINRAEKFQDHVFKSLPPVLNREDIFGSQIIMDADDNETDREPRLLSGASGLDAETAIKLVRELDGVIIPAHVNRESFSMLNTLGAIPLEYGFRFLECSKNCDLPAFKVKHPELEAYKWVKSSDAHFLWDILEQEFWLDLEEKSAEALLSYFR